jgi:histidine phosphotransfer protein HptB
MLVRKFLGKFKDDKSFGELTAALEAGDVETAFRAAHTMKGVCANLGLDSLFKLSSDVTEILRPKAEGAVEEAKKKLPDLEKEYKRVLEELKKLEED